MRNAETELQSTVLRIRQWATDRAAVHSAKATSYTRLGWKERRARDVDARLMRVLDFERALGQLPDQQQNLLTLTYRENQRQGHHRALTWNQCPRGGLQTPRRPQIPRRHPRPPRPAVAPRAANVQKVTSELAVVVS